MLLQKFTEKANGVSPVFLIIELYPYLRKLVQIVYGIPASSAIIERLFNESGSLLSRKRRSMEPDSHMHSVHQVRIKPQDALLDVVDIGCELDRIGNDIATESYIDTDE